MDQCGYDHKQVTLKLGKQVYQLRITIPQLVHRDRVHDNQSCNSNDEI
jgi:hypothetical protein